MTFPHLVRSLEYVVCLIIYITDEDIEENRSQHGSLWYPVHHQPAITS